MENKYDTSITLEENSSLTYMLKNIEPGTTVLEFGPATGYMTKYLKEELGCKVYIVEIDEDACKRASAYAQEAICGSAEDLQWYEKFQDIRFDYITFADVLEHLVNPGKVLARSAQLLKEDTGKILVSLPNIGHNAVLIDLLNNKFKYRTTGIMDNTHLRFFTHDSAVELFHENGLHVEEEDAVVFDLKYTGFGNSEMDISENIWSELRLREYGFVNQFLFTLTKNESSIKSIDKKKVTAQYECALYYTVDEEYSEKQKVLSKVELKDDEFLAEFVFDSSVMIKDLIIALLPFNGAISNMNIDTNATISEINPVNGFGEKKKLYFYGNEVRVQVRLENVTELKYVRLSGKVEAVQVGEVVKRYDGVIRQTNLSIEHLNNEIGRLNDENHRLNEKINEDNAFIEKVKATRWYRVFEKQIMKDK